jgi:hypothetical protein
MPFISESAMSKLAAKFGRIEAREEKLEQKEEKRQIMWRETADKARAVVESTAGAAFVGFLHGRYEDADSNFFIPRTSLPADLMLGGAGVAISFLLATPMSDKNGEPDAKPKKGESRFGFADDLLSFSNGILNGATAMYFRKHALAGRQADKFWAGSPELVGAPTHNHPSIGAAMSDAELAAVLRRTL